MCHSCGELALAFEELVLSTHSLKLDDEGNDAEYGHETDQNEWKYPRLATGAFVWDERLWVDTEFVVGEELSHRYPGCELHVLLGSRHDIVRAVHHHKRGRERARSVAFEGAHGEGVSR